jgi:alpha-beta hydrolase superfamily lysophospholipase
MDAGSGDGYGEGLFRGARGQKLYYQRQEPAGDPRAVVGVVRGSGEYCELYAHAVTTLVPHGFAVYGFDHREHTRLPGQSGYLTEWSQSQHDVVAFVSLIAEGHGEHPLFLLGNGLGGLLALTYALHHPDGLAAVVAFGPAPVEMEVAPLLTRVGRTLAGFWPRLPSTADPASPPTGGSGESGDKPPIAEAIHPASATVEGTSGTLGELSLPHLIVHLPVDGAAPNLPQLLADVEIWLEERLTGQPGERKV